MPTKRMNLSDKIFKITQSCSTIKRNGVGESDEADKPLYSYVKIEDVLDVVNPLLKKYKLILTGNVVKEPITHVGKLFSTTEVLVDWMLTDTEVALEAAGLQSIVFRVPGAGVDSQGKGIYKALTGSRKYAMVLIFNLKFGDEPEEVTNATRPEARPAANADASVS